ncbi:hypothetical protein ACFVT5_02610 [Streptomyces sp. NPDC058001]|uniref:hypothetical protein n=1 Tax=Streptomyces sp. NPDC058001 TaxID=3346300 RepID=UPI0036ECD82D
MFAALQRWEFLVRRMEGPWSDTKYYMVYEYLDQLTYRDTLEDFAHAMTPALRDQFLRSIAPLDHRYRAATVDDDGTELAQYWKPLRDGRETRWWWTRRPRALPPGW